MVKERNEEHPSTYFVRDRSNKDERLRLHVQDQLVTTSMGGVLPEQDDPARFSQVLDVGCGTGGWLIECAKQYPQVKRLVGVDISSTMLDYAREQAVVAGVSDRVEFSMMDALRMLEFPDDSFDLVNLRFGVSYLRTWDWPKLLQEFRRVLRSGGTVRLTEAIFLSAESCSSEAYVQINQYVIHTFYKAGHLFQDAPDGITSQLTTLLRQHGYNNIQETFSQREVLPGTDAWLLLKEDATQGLKLIVPFIKHWGSLPDDYDELRKQTLQQLEEETISIKLPMLTAWARSE